MKIVRCSCKHCRRGLRTKKESKKAQLKVRAARRRAKQDVKRGVEPETKVKLGYTD